MLFSLFAFPLEINYVLEMYTNKWNFVIFVYIAVSFILQCLLIIFHPTLVISL